MQPSSQDLHPRTGARFVFDKLDEAPRYAVTVYLPGSDTWSAELAWVEGQAQLDASPTDPAVDWTHAEALKLARVLRRDPKDHMVRWRGEP